jgi:predicted PhzF superfamily epimerase YddE/YHI9
MKLYHVDAFTTELFKGNPAGVCILPPEDIPDERKQLIAAELKHAETAFILIGDESISLRWFTPEKEVDLCGHATLSAAHILWEQRYVPDFEPIRFNTRSGVLIATLVDGMIELDFPRLTLEKCDPDHRLSEIFGTDPVYAGTDGNLLFLEIDDPGLLRTMDPDIAALAKFDPGEFLVTCRSDDARYDFISRFFAPAVGIPEDPVTGSAHCYLAPYWSEKLEKTCMTGFQASSRTGVVECELSGKDRVTLRGNAITFFATDIDDHLK